jgi:hypothetical protein
LLWLLVLALLLDGRLPDTLPAWLLALVDGRLLIVGRLLVVGLLTLALVLGRTDAPLLTVGRLAVLPLFTLALGALVPLDILPLVV